MTYAVIAFALDFHVNMKKDHLGPSDYPCRSVIAFDTFESEDEALEVGIATEEAMCVDFSKTRLGVSYHEVVVHQMEWN